jgi:hypothetical protein
VLPHRPLLLSLAYIIAPQVQQKAFARDLAHNLHMCVIYGVDVSLLNQVMVRLL